MPKPRFVNGYCSEWTIKKAAPMTSELPTCTESWWARPLTRAKFTEVAASQVKRMRHSKFGAPKVTDDFHRYDG